MIFSIGFGTLAYFFAIILSELIMWVIGFGLFNFSDFSLLASRIDAGIGIIEFIVSALYEEMEKRG